MKRLSDTIRVILRGKLTGTFDPDTVTSQDLGAAMTGADGSHDEPHAAATESSEPHQDAR